MQSHGVRYRLETQAFSSRNPHSRELIPNSPTALAGAFPLKLNSVRKHAMSLDAVTEEPHHNYSSFRVRGKIFVTIPLGEQFIHVFVGEEDREPALALYPEFIDKLLWGGKVVGLRVTLESARPTVVKLLVSKAYQTRVQKDASSKAARS
jgi:hypothetical protein